MTEQSASDYLRDALDKANEALGEARLHAAVAAEVLNSRQEEVARLERELRAVEQETSEATTFAGFVREQIRINRERLGVRQEDLAEYMQDVGFGWKRITVTEVERGSRRVSLDELIALAMIFRRPVLSFLAPDSATNVQLEPEGGPPAIPAEFVRQLFTGLPDVPEVIHVRGVRIAQSPAERST